MPALSGSSPNKWTCGRIGRCTERFRASGRHYNLVSTCCAPSQIQSTQFTNVHCHGLGKVSRLRMGHHHRDEELLLSIKLDTTLWDESPSRNLEAINQIYPMSNGEFISSDDTWCQDKTIPLATLHRPHRHQAGFTSKASHHWVEAPCFDPISLEESLSLNAPPIWPGGWAKLYKPTTIQSDTSQ